MKLYDQPKVALKTRMMVKSRTSFIDGGVRGPFARNTTVVLQIPHRKRQGLAPHRRGTAQETRPSDDFLQQCARDNNLNVRTLDLPICSPWTFRENHSPKIIYTVNRRNQPTAMDLHFLGCVRTRYKTEPETHTKSAHTVLGPSGRQL